MFRLPRAVVQREIAQIEALGVAIRCGVSVGADLLSYLQQHGTDLVATAPTPAIRFWESRTAPFSIGGEVMGSTTRARISMKGEAPVNRFRAG